MILPFLELNEDEIDAECYNCESIVSSEETSDAYKIGLDKIESFIKSKDHKYMLNNVLSDKDHEEIKITTNQKFQTLCEKLKSEQPPIAENCSDSDDDDMSEISIESEVDCSTFSHEKEVPRQSLISENSDEYISILHDKGPQVLKAKATVYPRIQTVPNQVYVQKGLNHKDTHELKSIVDQDNADGCGSFWTEPIDSIDETSGLSAKTSWRVKGKYVSEPLNNIHAKYDGSKQQTSSNSKNIPDKTLPKKNKDKCPEVSIASTSSTSKEGKRNNYQRKGQSKDNHILPKTNNSFYNNYSSSSNFKPISKNKSKGSYSPNQTNIKSWTHSNPPRILQRPKPFSSRKRKPTKKPNVVTHSQLTPKSKKPTNTFIPRKLLVYRDEKQTIENTFWIDRTKSFPVRSYLSRGPTQLWVPKSL